MRDWLRKHFRSEPAPLAGQPEVRRPKTYSADSGYVYEHYYEGYRAATSDGETGAEHVFQVSADRKAWSPVSVFLPDAAVAWWERTHGRALSATERYAVVKMGLFRAFDDRDRPSRMKEEVRLRETDLEDIVETLEL